MTQIQVADDRGLFPVLADQTVVPRVQWSDGYDHLREVDPVLFLRVRLTLGETEQLVDNGWPRADKLHEVEVLWNQSMSALMGRNVPVHGMLEDTLPGKPCDLVVSFYRLTLAELTERAKERGQAADLGLEPLSASRRQTEGPAGRILTFL